MTDSEAIEFEREIREKVAEENRAKRNAYKSEWRKKNREHLRQYNKAYRIRKRLCGGE